MPRAQAKKFRFQLPAGGGMFTTVSLAQSDSFSVDNSIVDATTKDAGGWTEIFPEGSIKTATIDATHVFAASADHLTILNTAMSAVPVISGARIYDADNGVGFVGDWMISNYSLEGTSPEGFVSASMTLQNATPIMVTGA